MIFLNISDKIQPIVLPPYSAVDVDFTNATSIVSGWGKAADGKFIYFIIKYLNVQYCFLSRHRPDS